MSRKILLVMAALLLFAALATTAWAANEKNFVAVLSGDRAGIETLARGVAIFHLNEEGNAISYKLIVANLDNISQAHIHHATGPVVTWLYPEAPPPVLIPGTSNGILMQGVITQEDLRGLLAGQSLEALLEQMRNGAFVNVHTSAFPGGEISGTIMAH